MTTITLVDGNGLVTFEQVSRPPEKVATLTILR